MRALAALRVDLVPVPLVDTVWPLLAPGFDRACRKTGGDTTVEYLWAECRSGSAFLAAVTLEEKIVGGAVLRFDQWTSGKRLKLVALCGEGMKFWLPALQEFLGRFAKIGGAVAVVYDARTGFARVYPKAKILRSLFEVRLMDGNGNG